jgi:hypothetical protein
VQWSDKRSGREDISAATSGANLPPVGWRIGTRTWGMASDADDGSRPEGRFLDLCLEADIDNMKDALNPTFTDPVLQKRLAKYLVQQCFRNSVLEDLHAGIAPSSKTGDYSDVVVCTPFGEIAWRRLSRLDDAEMKLLMIDVVDRTYQFLHQLFDPEVGGELLRQLAARDLLAKWEDPK